MSICLPSRELTYPPKMAFWVDDFPNFPRWDMLIPWRAADNRWMYYYIIIYSAIFGWFRSIEVTDALLFKSRNHLFQTITPLKINVEPKNHPIDFRKIILHPPPFFGSMWIFRGVFLKDMFRIITYTQRKISAKPSPSTSRRRPITRSTWREAKDIWMPWPRASNRRRSPDLGPPNGGGLSKGNGSPYFKEIYI